jgi:release factor glutamine methyltransferase
MPTIAEAIREALDGGKEAGLLAVDLRLLAMHDEGLKEQIDVLYHKNQAMAHYDLFKEQVERLKNNEPVEYIINEAQFLGRRLYVNEDVLIPRGETEELVSNLTERISDYYDPRNFLVCADIGTGSGAIAIAVKDAFPNWLMCASDISEKAMAVAKRNFASCGASVTPFIGNALEPYALSKTNLDIIISNPPYITDKGAAQASVRDYEPASSLWMDKNNSVYEAVFRDYLKVKKGSLLMAFEISPELDRWLEGLMKKYLRDYEYEFIMDLNHMKRFLFVYCH